MKRITPDVKKHIVLTIAVLLLFLLLAVVFTRPVAFRAPGAAVEHVSDPPFQAWSLAWDIHALSQNPFNLFNANIFYPNPYTLAYSDHQITNAILAMPIMAITHNPMQAANYMLIFNFFLCALGAYLLTVHLTGNRMAGVVAGIAFALAPYKLSHIVHLNLCTAGWIPLTFLFLHRYCEEGRPRDAALAALFFLLQVLSTWHYGLILAVAMLLFLIVRLITDRKTFTLKWILALAVAMACAALLVVPFVLPYLRLQKEDPRFTRSLKEVETFSADVKDFLMAPQENLLWGKLSTGMRKEVTENGDPAEVTEKSIFPGLMPLLLGLGGLIYLFRKGRGEERFSLWFYLAMLVVSAILCLGYPLYIFGHRLRVPTLYQVLYYVFPGFKAMRVPPRFSILIALSLAVLSGFAVKALLAWLASKRGVKVAALASILVVALLLVDLMSINMPMEKIPKRDEFPRVYSWLEGRKGDSPTVELPIPLLQNSTLWLELDPIRTYYSTMHWKKIMNGYSGFLPTSIYDASAASGSFPSRKSMDFFKKNKIKYIVVHRAELDPVTLGRIAQWDRTHEDFGLVRSFDSDDVYQLK